MNVPTGLHRENLEIQERVFCLRKKDCLRGVLACALCVYGWHAWVLRRSGARSGGVHKAGFPFHDSLFSGEEMSGAAARVHAFLSGTVQGVGMRVYVNGLARKLHLCGFVRNLRDGRVEVVVEGPRASIEKLFETIQTGPYAGYVTGVELAWEEHKAQFSRFEIVHG